MVDIENTFIIKPDLLPLDLEKNNYHEIIMKGQIVYPFINQQTTLWTNSGGSRGMGTNEIGKVKIMGIEYFPEPITGEIYTKVKFEVISLKENGLGRKVSS